jgi:hypothetical protein
MGNLVLMTYSVFCMFPGLEGTMFAIFICLGYFPAVLLDAEMFSPARAMSVAVGTSGFMILWWVGRSSCRRFTLS